MLPGQQRAREQVPTSVAAAVGERQTCRQRAHDGSRAARRVLPEKLVRPLMIEVRLGDGERNDRD